MTKEEAHAKAPICAAVVKHFREVFGEDQVKVIGLRENGLIFGTKAKPSGEEE